MAPSGPAFRRYYGPEFVSRAILRWLLASGIDTAHIDPGKPWQNGLDESVNGKFRDECLNVECFRNRHEATALIEQWRQHYNAVRTHSSLAYRTPLEYKATWANQGRPIHRASLSSNDRSEEVRQVSDLEQHLVDAVPGIHRNESPEASPIELL